MINFESLALFAWRAVACQEGIHDFNHQIKEMLRSYFPVDAILVRQWEAEPPSLTIVAIEGLPTTAAGHAGRVTLTPRQARVFQSWCQANRCQIVASASEIGQLIAPPSEPGRYLVVPLRHFEKPRGVLGLRLPDEAQDEQAWLALGQTLQEPYETALENDRRIHELAALREAAEADRGALLQRLGRSQLDDAIVGEQTGLRGVMERVRLVANSDVPVLVLGETGSGKEIVARALHHRGRHAAGPFIRVNCGAIPPELIDSQLFGHVRGAFTGADRDHLGWFERANGGTLFLDEVGELPLPAQVRLLRVLQDGLVDRVGGSQSIHVEVRVVAATHRDLATMVQQGKFREDLWYRLAVFPILIPPLRERRDDIPDLVAHFARRASKRFGLPVPAATEHDLRLLRAYSWPGNIRELAAVIDRAAILGAGRKLDVENALGWNVEPKETESSMPPASSSAGTAFPSLDDAIRHHIEAALARTQGRVEGPRGAAKLLQINPHTLRSRMRKMGITTHRFKVQ